MDCSPNQHASQGAHCALDMLPAELFPFVAKLLPAVDLGRIEVTSRALRAAVERAVRERATEWGGSGASAAERVTGESWAGLLHFIELRAQAAPDRVAAGGTWCTWQQASSTPWQLRARARSGRGAAKGAAGLVTVNELIR